MHWSIECGASVCDSLSSVNPSLFAGCRLHESQKHQEKQHTCTECDKSFLYFHQLRIHMTHHARRSIHPCRHCDLDFKRSSDLRAHLKRDHQGSPAEESEKSGHGCPECDFHAPSRYLTLFVICTCVYSVPTQHGKSWN